MPVSLCSFAEGLRILLHAPNASRMLTVWDRLDLEEEGLCALDMARRGAGGEFLLDEVDRLLQRAMTRVKLLTSESTAATVRLQTFRYAALERLQCAASAALVDRRFGVAGLRHLVEDEDAPFARRYFALLGLAEKHSSEQWDFLRDRLNLKYHHAFVGTAVEAMRYYPARRPARSLVSIFEAVRSDAARRRFLGPRILGSLYVLADEVCLEFCRGLTVFGHTAADPVVCEVTRALAIIRRITGRVSANVKFPDHRSTLAAAENACGVYDSQANSFMPVALI